jgi:hypothetical protein
VYAIDIVMSSGEGKPKMHDERETAVYKAGLCRLTLSNPS